jgi:hypothetical protein
MVLETGEVRCITTVIIPGDIIVSVQRRMVSRK